MKTKVLVNFGIQNQCKNTKKITKHIKSIRLCEEKVWLPGNKRSSEILGLYLIDCNKTIFQDKYYKLWADFFLKNNNLKGRKPKTFS